MKQFTFFLICLIIMTVTAIAQSPGTLDSSFGENGKVITGEYFNYSTSVILQPDGKIIQAGIGSYQGIGGFLLERFNTDGSFDLSFGKEGRVVTNLSDIDQVLQAIALQQDGKIIAAGFVVDLGVGTNIVMVRYMPDGTVDSSFGENGVVTTDIENTDYLRGLAIQPDGKILVTGNLQKNENDIERSFTVRYLTNGNPDESFGNKGIVITVFDTPTEINSITVQPDEKILVGGAYDYLSHGGDFVILRYQTNGNIDTDFGEKGFAKAGFGTVFAYSNAELFSMALQPDGKIVGAGMGGEGLNINMALARFETNGSLDVSFGENGRAIAAFSTEGTADAQAKKVLLQPDGKIIITGPYSDHSTFSYFALARYKSNGFPDSSFANYGLQTTDMGGSADCTDAALQKDGKILLSGFTQNTLPPYESQFALARYNGDDCQPSKFARIKRWLHRHGFTWDDWPGNNISYYSVQRSSNGNTFNEIARLFRHNNQQQYSYEDAAPLSGNNYYRLAAIGTDGRIVYSNTLNIPNNTLAIRVYPNPVKNSLQIEGLRAAQKTKLTIADFSGTARLHAITTGNAYSWNVAQLKPGNYIIKIETGGTTVSKKFVKE